MAEASTKGSCLRLIRNPGLARCLSTCQYRFTCAMGYRPGSDMPSNAQGSSSPSLSSKHSRTPSRVNVSTCALRVLCTLGDESPCSDISFAMGEHTTCESVIVFARLLARLFARTLVTSRWMSLFESTAGALSKSQSSKSEVFIS